MKKLIKLLIFIIIIIIFVIFGLFLLNIDFSYYKIEERETKFKESKKEDNDDYGTVGWLKVQGTDIDMPILIAKNRNWDYPVTKEKYAWTLARDSKVDKKIDIMGHNIFNLSSQPKTDSNLFKNFEQLMSFVYYDFAKDNLYIQFSNDNGDFIYKIFSVEFIPVGYVNSYYYIDYENDKHGLLEEQLDYYKKDSLYDYDVDVNMDDKFISLITCTRFFGNAKYEFIVNGRLLREDESIEKYDVKINKENYKKVEEKLKGGNINEENV